MKKYALALALVLGMSGVTWGNECPGISIIPANSLAVQPMGIAISFQNYVSGLACHQTTPIFTLPSGCHNNPPQCPSHEFHWPWHNHCGGGGNDPASTTASSSTSTMAGGPIGYAVADAASSSTAAHSTSTSSSHSQSQVLTH